MLYARPTLLCIVLISATYYSTAAFSYGRGTKQDFDFSYKFVQVHYALSEFDTSAFTANTANQEDVQGEGVGAQAWYGDEDTLFWAIEYQTISFKADESAVFSRYDMKRIGLGDAVKKNATTHLYGIASYKTIAFDAFNGDQEKASGYDLELGLRSRLYTLGELKLSATYESVFSSEVILIGEVLISITQRFDLLGQYKYNNLNTAGRIGVRYKF